MINVMVLEENLESRVKNQYRGLTNDN